MHINILNENECAIITDLINTSDKIIVCCHVNPDGDAIGSTLAWTEYLRTLGKHPMLVVPDQFPDFLHWLPGADDILRYDKKKAVLDKAFSDADAIFCLDFNCAQRLDAMSDALLESKARKVMIDHHPNPEMDTVLTISHPELSSTSELVFRLLWQLDAFEKMDKNMAIPIYCGMMTDTGGFTYNSNSPEIFFIISQLLTKNIDKDKIYRNVYNNYSASRLRLIGYILYQKMQVYEDYHVAYFTISRQDMNKFFFKKGDAEGLVNMPLQIKGLKMSISLREDTEKDNLIWVSLRSVDDFPCNEVANKFFNGGGHLNAAGGRLYCTMEEAENIVKLAIIHFQERLRL
jgi:phosphoesterase RecJ-like protein